MAYPERVLNKARELRSDFGLTLEEIVRKLDDEFGGPPSVETVGRWLKPDTPKASPIRGPHKTGSPPHAINSRSWGY